MHFVNKHCRLFIGLCNYLSIADSNFTAQYYENTVPIPDIPTTTTISIYDTNSS